MVVAGLIIGAVETVLAVAFAAFVFGWPARATPARRHRPVPRAAVADARDPRVAGGPRGVVGSVQDAAAAVLSVVAAIAAAKAAELAHTAQPPA